MQKKIGEGVYKVPVKPPIKRVKIELYWADELAEGYKAFDTVQIFAAFLRDNPDLAKAVGYVSKSKEE
ncbi:MAG TPA: hypothetical protein VIU12_32160 [Chryseolinea sp.]